MEHPRGRQKARVFAAAFGLGPEAADDLRAALLQAAQEQEAWPTERDKFGQRYTVDFLYRGSHGQARIRLFRREI